MTSCMVPVYRRCLNNGDSLEALINISRGITPKTPTSNGKCGICFILSAYATDKVDNLIDFAAVKRYSNVFITVQPGEQLTDVDGSGSVVGFIVESAENRDAAVNKCTEIARELIKRPEYFPLELDIST
ncbi:uncharacterized protein LOC141902928 [Tubulanus polymorphus]|uniref:uncharacterized protein LOC141902928 n=1 Tax=Tubulanus polymorphus TaxID=672921 RepID=UPI003DA256AD